jgi:hypothetical protein
MAMYNATIDRRDNGAFLRFSIGENVLSIALMEDNPNQVKTVFNELLKHLRIGELEFSLDDSTDDLYYQICREYIVQLNAELKSTYKELIDNGLLASQVN